MVELTISSPQQSKQLLFISLEKWDFVFRRNQFVCNLLCERHPDAKILWINPPYDPLMSGGVPADISLSPKPLSEHSRIYTLDLIKPLPNVVGRFCNEWIYQFLLDQAVAKLALREFTIWINNQSVQHCIRKVKRSKLIYDITDDWTASKASERVLVRTRADDLALLQAADEVIVCSSHLYQMKREKTRSLHLIPNGVDWQKYYDACAKKERHQDYANIKAPIAGYVGTLHEDRLDVSLLARVAELRPDIHFVLLGPNCLGLDSQNRLKSFANIAMPGARPNSEIPMHLSSFSVLIVPHVVSPFTESLDPLKLYEYMATGKPIVSTGCAGFRELAESVQIASSAEEFAGMVQSSLSSSELLLNNVDWAKKQSWIARVEEIEKVLGWSLPDG